MEECGGFRVPAMVTELQTNHFVPKLDESYKWTRYVGRREKSHLFGKDEGISLMYFSWISESTNTNLGIDELMD